MVLEAEEVEQFYRVWFPLLHFVNKKLGLVESFPASGRGASVAPADVLKLREALWADDSLRESFIEQNPSGLTPDDLALIASWKYRLAGKFFVFRYLKKYTVLLSDESPVRAYGVHGLVSPIEDVLGPYVPIYVETVLLPFGDRITYDSLMVPYRVVFGPGIRAGLNDDYRHAQEGGGIVTSLQPGFKQPGQSARLQQKKIMTAYQRELGRAGLSPKMITEHVGNIDLFVQSGRFSDNSSHGLLDFDQGDLDAYLSLPHANQVSVKRFIVFLRDTGRIDYMKAEEMLSSLKKGKKEG
ncbi:MAG: hypothetical protein M3014_15655 [Chloroflexota bacterium]|nr:hypothetical protein [Chloroflexota bacterium]